MCRDVFICATILSVLEGTILNNRYKLADRVGLGGMASVYRAEDMVLGRTVAIKMLHEGLLGDATFVRQFQQEAHSAANLAHPNIVTVHDIGQHEHRSYIVMEYVAGQTLKAIIRDHFAEKRFIPINRVLDLLIQICRGIGYAHRSGVVHCDIKPQNIIVTADERVKVTDFGIARAVSQASISLDRDGSAWGTPQYFSPEQASGDTPTPASDVYAIGIVMYETLTNRLPFTGENATAVAIKHLQESPKDIRKINKHVPEQLAKIVHKILDKEPSGRYRTAGQLGRILTAYRDQYRQQEVAPPILPIAKTVQVRSKPPAVELPSVVPQHAPQREPVFADDPTQFPSDIEMEINPPSSDDPLLETDYVAVTLGMAALLALLGLIPLWIVVARAWGVF